MAARITASLFMNAWRSEDCENYPSLICHSLGMNGKVMFLILFVLDQDAFPFGSRGDIAETVASDGPGSSISANGT